MIPTIEPRRSWTKATVTVEREPAKKNKKKRKNTRRNRYSFHLSRELPSACIPFPASLVDAPTNLSQRFLWASLLGSTSQYRMHFRSRPSRFAIPFVRGSFSRQIPDPPLPPRPSSLPGVHPRRECFTRRMTYIPNAFPYANRARSEISAANCGLSMRNAVTNVTPRNKRSREHSYDFLFLLLE